MPVQRHYHLKIVILTILFYALFCLPAAQAITYGSPDCTDNSTNTGCAHPNVVSITGFTPSGFSNFRCTGSLLSKDEDRILILTAGHCVKSWIDRMSDGRIEDIGVSFDAEIVRESPDSRAFRADQFVLGGSPLLNRHHGPSLNAWNTHYDYAVVAFDVPSEGLETADGTAVDLTGIEPVVLPVEDFILTILDPGSPPLLTNVGYGTGESLKRPGDGGNAGGATPDLSVFGLRYVSMFTAQLNTMLKRQSMVIGSQNPAHGYNGTCNGDSGGPNFFVEANNDEIQIGVTSSGDSPCRSTQIISRLDIPEAIEFLECTINASDELSFQACGCSSLNKKGTC